MRPFNSLAVLLAACVMSSAAERAVIDRAGRLSSMIFDGDELAVRGRIEIPSADWNRIATPAAARRMGDTGNWQGSIAFEQGKTASFRETVTEEAGRLWLALEVTADAALDSAGVYYTVEVPRAEFAGGQAAVRAASGTETAAFPSVKPAGRDFLRAEGSGFVLSGSRNLRLTAEFDSPRQVALADRWERSGHTFAALIQLHAGPLPPGKTVSLKLGLSLAGDPDTTPARLTLDPAVRRYKFHGIGGNYCFNIESPVTQYTLDNLKVAWGRTEMSLSYWEPENDNESPDVPNWDYFRKRLDAYPRLRLEMEMGRKLQDKGIPYITSIWAVPEWAYTDPGPKPQRRGRRRIAPDKWDELLESIGTYLLFAKREFGAEPDMFSFNEANIGVDVLLTPEEHRDSIKRLGAHFEKLGLKTKLLLGDATGPQGTHVWALAAAADPEAMRYVRAVGFHSWGGATPEQYKAWGDLAEWLQLPLLVTELGYDAAAYNNRVYDSFHYGIQEVRMYQELLLHARPQGTHQWEFTADYGIVRAQRRQDGGVDLTPTSRFWFVKHFTDLTPHNSEALATTSDNPNVLLTAFVQGPVYTLHVANTGAARQVTLTGLPAVEFRAVRTSENENFAELPALRPTNGSLRFEIPARSLLTLTTMKP
ncbi:MAG: hypothetical protein IT159_00920 [Bryobacterales bacterium]|nr:hypothetical protein [Bryobacterales bacterium]